MERIPILKMGDFLLVTIQVDLYDQLAENLESDLINTISKHSSKGVLIDISAVSIIDSFMGRILKHCCNVKNIRCTDRCSRNATRSCYYIGRTWIIFKWSHKCLKRRKRHGFTSLKNAHKR